MLKGGELHSCKAEIMGFHSVPQKPKVALEHAEHNGMKMKTSFQLLLTLKANKEEE